MIKTPQDIRARHPLPTGPNAYSSIETRLELDRNRERLLRTRLKEARKARKALAARLAALDRFIAEDEERLCSG